MHNARFKNTLLKKFEVDKYGVIPASFLFIFVLFVTLQFRFKLKKQSVHVVLGIRTRGHRMVGRDVVDSLSYKQSNGSLIKLRYLRLILKLLFSMNERRLYT